MLDGYIAFPLLMLMLSPGLFTLVLLVSFSSLLVYLDKKGMRLPMLLRWMRASIAGSNRYIRPWWRK